MSHPSLTQIPAGWAKGPDQWSFSPHGAAYHDEIKLAVVADLHLGYEATRASMGDYVPEFSLSQIQNSLGKLFEDVPVERLVVAGDVMESKLAVMNGAGSILSKFVDWLVGQGVEPVLLAGNHDAPTALIRKTSIEVQGWLIHHGDRQIQADAKAQFRGTISGHIHPILRSGGRRFRSFLACSDQIVLPAFTNDASGCDILTDRLFSPQYWNDFSCFVSSGSEVLSFGNLAELRARSISSS